MKNFPIADGVVLLVVAAFFLRSYFRGVLREIFSLVSLLMGYLAAGRFGPVFGELLSGWVSGARWVQVAANSVVFIGVWLGVALIGRLATRLAVKGPMGPSNRIAGGVIGLAKGVFVVGALFAVFETLAPSLLPPPGENERVMPYVRRAGRLFSRVSKLDLEGQMDLLKKSIGVTAEPENLAPTQGTRKF